MEVRQTDCQNAELMGSFVGRLLTEKGPMLSEYFGIQIVHGRLMTIPNLLDGYQPQIDGLPKFLLRLATKVDWDREYECFRDVSREIAKFYSLKVP